MLKRIYLNTGTSNELEQSIISGDYVPSEPNPDQLKEAEEKAKTYLLNSTYVVSKNSKKR